MVNYFGTHSLGSTSEAPDLTFRAHGKSDVDISSYALTALGKFGQFLNHPSVPRLLL